MPPSAVKMHACLPCGVCVVRTVQALPRESLVTGGEAVTESKFTFTFTVTHRTK